MSKTKTTAARKGTKSAKAAPAAKATTTKAKAKTGAAAKKLSALNAAAKVLVEFGAPMNALAMIEMMAKRGYWTSPNGRTPAATLYAAIIREIAKKGKDSRFKKTERGLFAATGKE